MGSVPAFCHLNTRTCWGEDGGLGALERTLAQRLVDAPPGSYTKKLFEDPALLKNKLMEEAMELAEAAEPDHVAAEAADLIYFALVRCAKAGVAIADVEAHLDRRALKVRRRAGDSKPYRVEAARAFEESLKAAAAGAAAGAPA
jgi:phosphoribosyl-ATP pyrophosphohydrolase/phosphoribosyl-AMP cyclohydrolase/histidinol dehydrogenase